MTVWSREF